MVCGLDVKPEVASGEGQKGKERSMKFKIATITAAAMLAGAWTAGAAMVMPDLGNVPTGWTTDRYDPTSFSNVGTYQGRANVLGIEITSAGNLANRPGGQQNSFYNTQGRQHAVSGGAGSVLSADLWIPTTWAVPANGSFRSDIWGVMTDGSAVSDYPILGFTSYGGASRFRVWDDTAWVDLATSVNYDAWNSLAISYTGSSYVYSINGTTVYTDNTINGSTGFSAVIMQAYNFADPSISGATLVDYTAHWSNTPVPEPSTYVAGALLLLPFGISTIRKLRKNRTA